MADLDGPASIAARRILGAEEPALVETENGESVDLHVQNFFALAQLTPDGTMPDDLMSSIESAIHEAGESAVKSDEKEFPPAPRTARSRRRKNRSVRQIKIPLTAAVLTGAALLLSFSANYLLSRRQPFVPEAAVYLSGSESAPDAAGVLLHDGRTAVIHANGLAKLSPGYRYVVWHTTVDGELYLGPLTMLDGSHGRLLVDTSTVGIVVSVTIESDPAPSVPGGPRVLIGLAGD